MMTSPCDKHSKQVIRQSQLRLPQLTITRNDNHAYVVHGRMTSKCMLYSPPIHLSKKSGTSKSVENKRAKLPATDPMNTKVAISTVTNKTTTVPSIFLRELKKSLLSGLCMAHFISMTTRRRSTMLRVAVVYRATISGKCCCWSFLSMHLSEVIFQHPSRNSHRLVAEDNSKQSLQTQTLRPDSPTHATVVEVMPG